MPTERDVEILATVAEHRVLAVSQLAILRGISVSLVRRRLRGLVDTGLVRMAPHDCGRPGRPEQIASMTPAGVAILRKRGVVDRLVPDRDVTADRLRCVDHQLLVNWFRVHLSGIERAVPEISSRFLSENAPSQVASDGSLLRDRVSTDDATMRDVYFTPDGVLTLTHRERAKSLLFFLEADTGSETRTSRRGDRRDVQQKILNYQAYFRSGRYKRYAGLCETRFNGFRLLFVTTTAVRLSALCRLVARMPPSDFIWLTDQASMFEAGLAAAIWKRGGRPTPDHSILGQALACPSPVVPRRQGTPVPDRTGVPHIEGHAGG